MIALDHHPSGRHFLQIPGPSPVPDRILRAMSLPTIDHRGPEFAHLGLEGDRRAEAGVPHPASGGDLPRLGHRRMGGGAGQHDEPRRCGADVRDRPLRHAVAEDGAAPGPAARVSVGARHRCRHRPAQRLAPRRAGRPDRAAPARRHASIASRRCAWCTTKPPPASPPTSPPCARPSTPPAIRRC